jgi:L-threonylcarbamoyladenylate synthase
LITKINKISRENPINDMELIKQGSKILRNGGLVSFTTETVYGLGANALDKEAVKRIYAAKGRPSDNPLIVHIESIDKLEVICKNISEEAVKLIDRFWPGPLTIILDKTELIPYETSGGLNTIAVRIPSNKMARLLIEYAGVPVAAPSANISGKPSPTNSSHVIHDLNGKIDMILDGGDCDYGIESTVIDMTGKPRILRPGYVTKSMIEACLGFEVANDFDVEDEPKSPGMKYLHYSPNGELTLISGENEKVASKIKELVSISKRKTAVLATTQTAKYYENLKCLVLIMGNRENSKSIESNLYAILRKLDDNNIQEIFAEGFLEEESNVAIINRLEKAAGYKIINV